MVKPRAKVLFQWNQHRQSDSDLNGRAKALDGKIAEIMGPPLWSDGKRVQIRSPQDPRITLAVKRKYLEFIQPPPSTMPIQPLHIDLLVDWTYSPLSNVITHVLSSEHLQKELAIANDERYHLVLVNHPDIRSKSVIKSNRLTTKLHRDSLVLTLLNEVMSGCRDQCGFLDDHRTNDGSLPVVDLEA